MITAKEVDNVIESGAFAPRSVYTTCGRCEARVRTLHDPSGVMSGMVLTWPTSNYQPLEGELDFYEAGRQRTNQVLRALGREQLAGLLHTPRNPIQ